MTKPPTELLFRVNGIQPAFGFEFGLDSPRTNEGRCTDPYRQANVSYSLVQRRGGEVVRHTLIDVGMGVVPSLLEFERSHGVHVVHDVIVSHPHFDHFAQLEWLLACTHRNGRPEQPRPQPVYASPECWDAGPMKAMPLITRRVEHRPLHAGSPVVLGEMTVTPFAVEHGPSAPGALGFVVQHGPRKVVLTCDFLRVPDEDDPLLIGADVAFLEANTWHPAPRTNHSSVLDDLRLVRKWRPKRTYLIHYSGYDDKLLPHEAVNDSLEMDRFRAELDRVRGEYDVRPALHGMILGDTVPWPSG